jgi:glutathione-specific gamma-glutamylcyclotransferase
MMSDTVPLTASSIALDPAEDLWVFGYGSLMWRPGFEHVESQPALLRGAHRALCIRSFRHRGTPDAPGLVLGLDQGGSCRGVAFRVARERAEATHAYLTEREQMNRVYKEQLRPLVLADGRRVRALAYVADRAHVQYARLSRAEILAHIRAGYGESGACRDYVLATLAAMASIGITDHALGWLSEALSPEALSPEG